MMKNTKKILALLLALTMIFGLAACTTSEPAESAAPSAEGSAAASAPAGDDAAGEEMAVAMVTDYGDITDQSFNQTTYEACKSWATANSVKFDYKKPTDNTTPARVAMIETAIDEGYSVLVLPGFAFAEAITQVAADYPDVKFVALDVAQSDLEGAQAGYTLPENVYCAVYQEELCGYMAGVAAVKLGYKNLGFLGGMSVPAVVRYGYGFVQGANAAAEELGIAGEVSVKYAYGNQFFGDADITARMDDWYQNQGVQVVFACGGGIYTSAAEAAAKVEGGKVIGVDVDQKGIIDGGYGEGMTVTSAMKGLAPTVDHMLTEIKAGNFANYGGKIETLGLIDGADPAANYVQLAGSTQFGEGFTEDDYKALVADMFSGAITVSNDISAMPAVTITVDDQGNIK